MPAPALPFDVALGNPPLQPGAGSDSARADDVVCSLHASAHQFLGFPEARRLDARAHAVYLRAAETTELHGREDRRHRVRVVLLGRQAVPCRDS